MKHGRLRRQLVNGTDWTFENKLLKPSTMDVYWGTRAKELLRKSKDRLIKSRISLIIDSHNIHNSPKQILAILRPFVQIQSSNHRHLRSSATERFPNILSKVCVCRKIKGDSAKKNDELEQADWRKNGINYVNQTECIGFQRWKVNNGRKSPMYWSHLSVRLLLITTKTVDIHSREEDFGESAKLLDEAGNIWVLLCSTAWKYIVYEREQQ